MLKVALVACLLGIACAEWYEESFVRMQQMHSSKNFEVRYAERFRGMSLEKAKSMMGTRMGTKPGTPIKDIELTAEDEAAIPSSFDSYQKWPKCKSTIEFIKDQADCGSCWAVAASNVVGARECIANMNSLPEPGNEFLNEGKPLIDFSAEQIMSCCTWCGDGCQGGYPIDAMRYWSWNGVVTGGWYGSNCGCQPYMIPPCPPSGCSGPIAQTPRCSHSCRNGFSNSFNQDKHYAMDHYQISNNVQKLQTEIMTNGPIECAFNVYENFMSYYSGVYDHTAGQQVGGHAVTITGWTVMGGEKAWIIHNSCPRRAQGASSTGPSSMALPFYLERGELDPAPARATPLGPRQATNHGAGRFEDLLIQLDSLSGQIAAEHDRMVSELQATIDGIRGQDTGSHGGSQAGSRRSFGPAQPEPPSAQGPGSRPSPPANNPVALPGVPGAENLEVSCLGSSARQLHPAGSISGDVHSFISDGKESTDSDEEHPQLCDTAPTTPANALTSRVTPTSPATFYIDQDNESEPHTPKRALTPAKVLAALDQDRSSVHDPVPPSPMYDNLEGPSGPSRISKGSSRNSIRSGGRRLSQQNPGTPSPNGRGLLAAGPIRPAPLSVLPGPGARRPSLGPVANMAVQAKAARSRQNTPNGHLAATTDRNSGPIKGSFTMWPVWGSTIERLGTADWEQMSVTSQRSAVVEQYRHLKSADFMHVDDSDNCVARSVQRFVIHPSSFKRLVWVVCSVIMISYDVLVMPLKVFEMEESLPEQIMHWVTMLFWTMDLIASMFVGYHDSSNLEMRIRHTSWRYLKTWGPFDLSLVILDWVTMILTIQHSGDGEPVEAARTLRSMKTIRMTRALQALRLLRIVKMPEFIKENTYLIGRSEYTSLTLGILKHLLAILLVNHFIACVWYLVGKGNGGWVQEYCANQSLELIYMTALHWSLTQFTPATMEVQPQNFAERTYAVSVLLFALITFSSFVSSITNLMTHLRTLRSQEVKQFMKLERYLHDRSISFHLSIRVRRYLEHVQAEKARQTEEQDVELLEKLSTPLKMELRYEVHSPLLSRHPFFKHLSTHYHQVKQRLCFEGLKTMHIGSSDNLFHHGETAHCMYFVVYGMLLYSRGVVVHRPQTVEEGEWVSEPVLWTPWEHRGEMRAVTEASLVTIHAGKFQGILSKNKAALQQPALYAMQIVDQLNSMERQELSDIWEVSDLEKFAREAFESHDDELIDDGRLHGFLVPRGLSKVLELTTGMRGRRDSFEMLGDGWMDRIRGCLYRVRRWCRR